jgi:hypothetical protein
MNIKYDVEGDGRDLLQDTIPEFAWRDPEKQEKLQSE